MIKKIWIDSEAKPAKDGKPAKPAFKYEKIVTEATKRGGKDEAQDAGFPTFAELVEMLQGNVEFGKDDKGKWNGESNVCKYIIDGWNLESNQKASFAANNTEESLLSKADEMLLGLATKAGKTLAEFKAALGITA